ncbi:unnamed protein product [Durusdinium trenchii]|uniref:Uncharacterized protein n=1 Tax=Durusdinium trenchii TaxID=1381693 RepID=A0ABP0SK39_9DINO
MPDSPRLLQEKRVLAEIQSLQRQREEIFAFGGDDKGGEMREDLAEDHTEFHDEAALKMVSELNVQVVVLEFRPPADGDAEKLYGACSLNKLEELETLLKEPLHPEALKPKSLEHAVRAAVGASHWDCIALLLEAGTKTIVDLVFPRHQAALALAEVFPSPQTRKRHSALMEELLEKMEDLNSRMAEESYARPDWEPVVRVPVEPVVRRPAWEPVVRPPVVEPVVRAPAPPFVPAEPMGRRIPHPEPEMRSPSRGRERSPAGLTVKARIARQLAAKLDASVRLFGTRIRDVETFHQAADGQFKGSRYGKVPRHFVPNRVIDRFELSEALRRLDIFATPQDVDQLISTTSSVALEELFEILQQVLWRAIAKFTIWFDEATQRPEEELPLPQNDIKGYSLPGTGVVAVSADPLAESFYNSTAVRFASVTLALVAHTTATSEPEAGERISTLEDRKEEKDHKAFFAASRTVEPADDETSAGTAQSPHDTDSEPSEVDERHMPHFGGEGNALAGPGTCQS